jgi:hypothetical protein
MKQCSHKMNRQEFKSSWKVPIILKKYIEGIYLYFDEGKTGWTQWGNTRKIWPCMCENLPRALHPPSNLTCTGSQHFAYSSLVLLIPSPPININSGLSWTSWIFAACRWWCCHLYTPEIPGRHVLPCTSLCWLAAVHIISQNMVICNI